ncbi:hypothetical protein GCM10011375_32510 [Hymenobacter qilianensis]|uniref:Uncharacterized protein n=1 Tax=Hymenobacter qilianensis TaxID=1385715 RepID=A0ACB5PV35_9BACT|nr:hypothetical protein GCM10011375_32510 [Hymenobacter qilianensis]
MTLFLFVDVGGAEKDIYRVPPLQASSVLAPTVGQLLGMAFLAVIGCGLAEW